MKLKINPHSGIILLVMGMFLLPLAGSASAPAIKARLDSTQILMGRTTMLRLEVVQDKGKPGSLVMFSGARPGGIVGLCGDSVELRAAFKRDTVELGSNRIQINYTIPLQSFDSGFYRLPEFLYASGADTVRSNRLSLKVVPVKVGENDEISDYAPPSQPDGKSIFDKVPDFIVDYWWIWLAIIIALAIALYAWSVYRKRGTLLPKKPEPTPYEVAVRALAELKERHLWENGQEREYFTQLTEILRNYLDGRFGINAMEMTSRQIIETLASDKEIKEKRGYVRQILDVADFVKFAKLRPMPADNIAAFDNAVRFVEETKPLPPAPTDEADKSESDKDVKSNDDKGKEAAHDA